MEPIQTPAPPAPTSRPIQVVAALAVALTAGALDQLLKWGVSEALVPGQPVWLVPRVLSLSLRTNPNGAFGLFAGFPADLRLPILLALSVLAILAISVFTLRALGWSVTVSVALGLILGGAVGNQLDRLLRGEVVDFINIHFGAERHWPTFNLADVAITAGSLILVFLLVRAFAKKAKDKVLEGP
jgi:signal peptidase II